jgi:hypothetical protein
LQKLQKTAHFVVGLRTITLTIRLSIARIIVLALLELHPFSEVLVRQGHISRSAYMVFLL